MPYRLFTCVPEVLSCVLLLTCIFVPSECETQDIRDTEDTYNLHRYKRSNGYKQDKSPFLEPGVIIGILVGIAGVLVAVGVGIFLCRFLFCKHTTCCGCCPCADRWEERDFQESDLVPSKGAREDSSSPTHSVSSAQGNGVHPRQSNPKTGRLDNPAAAADKPPDYYDELSRNARKPKDTKKASSKEKKHSSSDGCRDDVSAGNSVRNEFKHDSDEADHSPRFLHTAAVAKRKGKSSGELQVDDARNYPRDELGNDCGEARRSPQFLHAAIVAKRKGKEGSGLRSHRSRTPTSEPDNSDREQSQNERYGKPRGPNSEKFKHRRHQNLENEPFRRGTGREPTWQQNTGGIGADLQPSYEAAGSEEQSEFNHRNQETSHNSNLSYPIAVISDLNEMASMQHVYGADPYEGSHFNSNYCYHGAAELDERSGVDRLPPTHHRQRNIHNPQHFFNPVPLDSTDSGDGDRELHSPHDGGYGRDQRWNSSGLSPGRDSSNNPSRIVSSSRPRPPPKERDPADYLGAASVSSDRRRPACAVRLFSGAENHAFNTDSTETTV